MRCLDRLLVRLHRHPEVAHKRHVFWATFKEKLRIPGNGAVVAESDANNLFLVLSSGDRIRELFEACGDVEGLSLLDQLIARRA